MSLRVFSTQETVVDQWPFAWNILKRSFAQSWQTCAISPCRFQRF
jgi:hypothetical protein